MNIQAHRQRAMATTLQARQKRIRPKLAANVLAGTEHWKNRRRLWKGLERFVNCGDSLNDYAALGKAFPDFFPLDVEFLPWHLQSHRLFLVYRDTLRKTWGRRKPIGAWDMSSFLLGLTNENHTAMLRVQEGMASGLPFDDTIPLYRAWWDILAGPWQEDPVHKQAGYVLRGFQHASILYSGPSIWAVWPHGVFVLDAKNDFQRAFYLLFRESWRARICPLCKTYFVARKPRDTYCSTECSNRSRSKSNMNWWNRVGVKRRRKLLARKRRNRK